MFTILLSIVYILSFFYDLISRSGNVDKREVKFAIPIALLVIITAIVGKIETKKLYKLQFENGD